jgi:hypothetical protein
MGGVGVGCQEWMVPRTRRPIRRYYHFKVMIEVATEASR